MLEAYRTGADVHTLTAQYVLGVNDVKAEYRPGTTARDVGKIINFGLLYGAGGSTLQRQARMDYGVVLTLEEAKRNRDRWFATYPGFLQWHRTMKSNIQHQLVSVSPLGRVRHLEEAKFYKHQDEELKRKASKAVREGINHPVQSFASDLLLMTLNRVQDTVKEYEARVICEVHDELDFLVPKGKELPFAEAVKRVMEDTSWLSRFGVTLTVPVEAELSAGNYWGEQERIA
jgi:DNA polymerase-1